MHGPIQPAIAVMDFAQLHMAGFPALSFAKGHTHTAAAYYSHSSPFCFSFSSVFPSNYYTKYVHTTYIAKVTRTEPLCLQLLLLFFSLGFFFTTKKVSSVNEKWLPFDSCPLKSRLLWYFAWHTTTDCCRGLCRVARDGGRGWEDRS